MITITNTASNFSAYRADKLGVAASVLCAIHCAAAPILLLFLPTFGAFWAHPISHALVAVFIVPLATFSIYKGYQIHRKRWVVSCAVVGILLVLGGAVLPAFSKEGFQNQEVLEDQKEVAVYAEPCVDACCPSLQVNDNGATSLHVPPAAIVTTLGGIFLILAHVGNLCSCRHSCRTKECCGSSV